MDDESEDLLGDGDSAGLDEEDDDMLSSTPDPQEIMPPSENELRLGRKVLDLEKERNTLASELQAMKSRFPAHDTTMPVSVPESSTQTPQLITIPHELLPTLHILRSHITELTRDNEALRYTFLGGPTASPSKVTLDTPSTAQAAMEGVQGLDLRVVLGRVKELIKENEELGEMVLEAGRGSSKEWQKALDESKAVITSLDSDLAHHLTVVQSLRSELVAYKTQFGPLPTKAKQKESDLAPGASRDKTRDINRDRRDKPRDVDRAGRDTPRNSGSGARRSDPVDTGSGGTERDGKASIALTNGGGGHDRRRENSRRDEPRRPNGGTSGRKEEDREYKRRR